MIAHAERVKLPQVRLQWAKLIRRLLGLKPGRYAVVVDVGDDGPCGWEVAELGKRES